MQKAGIVMEDFLKGLTGCVITPFSPCYPEDRQGYNRAIQQFPLVIVYCQNITDVRNAVIWSRRHQVPIRIRNGGHNYEGYSNGDYTLIIDLSEMKALRLDEEKRLLKIQGGATNEDVYQFVSSKGYPFPGGTCPTVGIGGYALGGGWGLSCRMFGLGCDSLTEVELVNAKGDIVIANQFENSDLFWACRGAGGGNFGVVISMTFKLPHKVEKVTLIEIDYLGIGSGEQEKFLSTWQSWSANADERMTLISRIYNSTEDGLAALVRGIFYGSPREAKEILGKFLELENAAANIEYTTFLEAVTIIGSVYPDFESFYSGSRFVLKHFSYSEISNLVDLIQKPAAGSVFTGLSMYALGGKVAEINKDSTAFFYREAKYIIWLESVWESEKYTDINMDWINKHFSYLKSITTGSYVNFPYGNFKNYLKEYYGNHVEKLREIKSDYDPYNVFSFPQGIGSSNTKNVTSTKRKWRYFNIFKKNKINYRGFRYVDINQPSKTT